MPKKQQGKLLSMEKFREIIRLHDLGYNQTQIARSCAVARSTVQDYIRRATAKGLSYEELQGLSDSEAHQRLGKQSASSVSKTEIEFAPVYRELTRKGVTLALLWQEGLDRGDWTLSYGQFCRRYNRWKGTQKLSMRQTYRGGEKMLVDYCGMTMSLTHLVTGEITQAQIFVACLGASNYTFAEATERQTLANWLGSHQRALEFFGGVPEEIIPDNLKSGVTDPCRYEPGINRSYQGFAEHYHVAVVPARPKAPRDKSKVEKAVQEVERQILARLRDQQFHRLSDLNDAMRPLLDQLNNRTMYAYGMSRRELFEQVDQGALKPLPKYPFVFATWKRAKVSPDYHISLDTHYYSVPYWHVGHQVMVKTTEHLVEVFYDNQRIATHARSMAPYRHTTLDHHMPPEHWAYKRQSKETFLAWAHQIGPHTHTQVEAIFNSKDHDEQAFRSLKGLQSLATRYGTERLEDACKRANTLGMSGYRRLKHILQHHLDQTPVLAEVPTLPSSDHENVRGSAYYN